MEGTGSIGFGLFAVLDRLKFMPFVLWPLNFLRTPNQVAADARISPGA